MPHKYIAFVIQTHDEDDTCCGDWCYGLDYPLMNYCATYQEQLECNETRTFRCHGCLEGEKKLKEMRLSLFQRILKFIRGK